MLTKETICLGELNGVEYKIETEFEKDEINEFRLVYKDSDSCTPSNSIPICENELFDELLIIDSVFSGRGRTVKTDFANIVVRPFLDALKIKYKLIKTTGKDSIKTLASSLDKHCAYTVLFISGDTSISEFLNHLQPIHEKISIYPIPMGTGNAWASSLKLRDPGTAFSYFVKGSLNSTEFPLYEAIFSNGYSIKFFIILSMGFHANLLHLCESTKYQKMGIKRFQIASEEVLEKYNLDIKITLPGVLSGHFSYFVVINTTHLEPNYIPSPSSDPLEPFLQLLGFESELNKNELLHRITKGYSNNIGTDIQEPHTIYTTLPQNFDIVVENCLKEREKFELCCDGQLLNILDFHTSGCCKFSVRQCLDPSIIALSPKQYR